MVASIKPHRDELGLSDGLLLIDGAWAAGQAGETWNHSHPATGEEVASFPIAGPQDVDAAVRAARRAFDEGPWPRARATERIRVLRRIADAVREHGDELLALQALDNSVPLSFGSVYGMSAAFVADVFDHHAGWVDKLAGETLPPYQGGDHLVLTLREPVGVVGAIIPWNAPLLLFAQKAAPALAATPMATVPLGLSGQVCLAQTGALVHRDVADEFLATAEVIGGMVSYGSPFDPTVPSSPLINTRQMDRVLGLIAEGQAAGARLVSGGTRGEGDLAAGNFVAPTLFTDVTNDMSIAREEIFGPVLSVIPFSDEDEALRIANDTQYGLAATVWTSDIKRALRMTKAIRAGTVGINGYQLEPHAAFGGYPPSGLGREGGRPAIESYTEGQTVLLPFTDEMM